MTDYQISNLETKINDLWWVIDRESDEQKIAKLCGKLDGINLVLEYLDLKIMRDENGRRRIVKEG